MPILAQRVDSYVTEIVLPMDLHTDDGILLPQGHFDLKVQIEKGGYALLFSKGEQVVATIKSQPPTALSKNATTPVVGTLYLRSDALPMGTAEERQFSKTGRPQYQDEIAIGRQRFAFTNPQVRRDGKSTLFSRKESNVEDGGEPTLSCFSRIHAP